MVDKGVRVAHDHGRLVLILPDRIFHRNHGIVLNCAGEEHAVQPSPAMSIHPEVLSFEVFVEKNHVLLGCPKHFRVATKEATFLTDSKVHIQDKLLGQLSDLSN